MPATGIEPVREYKSRRILSPVRLPVPPLRQNGWRWIRTTESVANRFTVCPLWPLGNPSKYGTYRARTYDPLLVRQMLSQLSYDPICLRVISNPLCYYTITFDKMSTLFLIFFIFSNFYTIPCAVIASTTFSNPAILAPTT